LYPVPFGESDYAGYQNLTSAARSVILYPSPSLYLPRFHFQHIGIFDEIVHLCLSLNEKLGHPITILKGIINQRLLYYLCICNLVSERAVRSPQRLQRQYTSLAPCSRSISFGFFLLRNTRHTQKKRIRFRLHQHVRKETQSPLLLPSATEVYVKSLLFKDGEFSWRLRSRERVYLHRKYIAYRSNLERHATSPLALCFSFKVKHSQIGNLINLPVRINCSPDYIPVKFHNEELRNLYSSSDINRMIKLRTMKWAVYVACAGEKRNAHKSFWLKCQNERNH
jgi:hypothetical protein